MFAQIKLSARRALLGEELVIMPGILLILVCFLVLSLCNAVLDLSGAAARIKAVTAFLTLPLALFTLAPLKFRMQRRYIRLYTGDRNNAGMHFEDVVSSCILGAELFFIRLFYFAAYEALPSAALLMLINSLKSGKLSANAVIAVACGIAAAALIGAAFAFVSVQKYSKAEFYLAAYDGISPSEAIKISKKHTSGKLLTISAFKLGFLPWLMLCVFGVPVLFVMPYYRQSLTGLFIDY